MRSLSLRKLALDVYLFTRMACLRGIYVLLFGAPKKDPEGPLVVLRTSALGDFLFSVPALGHLRKTFPKRKIYFLTTSTTDVAVADKVRRYSGPKLYPWLGFVVPALVDEAISFDGTRLLPEARRLRNELAGRRARSGLILAHPGEPSWSLIKKMVFLRALGLGSVAGWRGNASIGRFRRAQYEAGLYGHKVAGPMNSAAELTGHRGEISFPLQFTAGEVEAAASWMRTEGIAGRAFVVIAPGSVQPHKRWPIENFSRVALGLLASEEDLHFVVVGPSGDRELSEALRLGLTSQSAGVHCLIGAPIPVVAEVMRHARLVLANDGGGAHLGAAVGTAVVTLVPGIEYPGSIEPWGWSRYAIRNEVTCAPCYSFTSCPRTHNSCMRGIPSEAVLEACRLALREVKTGPLGRSGD